MSKVVITQSLCKRKAILVMATPLVQYSLPLDGLTEHATHGKAAVISNSQNSIAPQDRRIHDWYRFVLSYPPHLVRDYLHDFGLTKGATVLDPFCGTGTTVVEAKLCGFQAIGIEANPFPHFASSVKTNWNVNPDKLLIQAEEIAQLAYHNLAQMGIDDRTPLAGNDISLKTLSPEAIRVLIKDSISPLPLHKTLVLLEQINQYRTTTEYKYCLLSLGNALVNSISNLRFGPEVGVGKIKEDVQVISAWLHEVRRMVTDLRQVQGCPYPNTVIHLADARELCKVLEPSSIDAVITSPPYPNEKDYTRTTRLESVVLGFYRDMPHLREYKKTLLRSNTRGVYKVDDDDQWIAQHTEIQKIAEEIEQRRIDLGKTSGFEKLYARVTKLYFGGMTRHLAQLRSVLKPNAQLAYVVGDQASYLQVMIRTGELLADIAQSLGYEVVRIDLFRTRFATATQSDLREEVVVLRWPGEFPIK